MKKTALITGASSGIGLEFAKILAREGYDLALVARREDRLNALKNQLENKYKIKVLNIVCDLYKSNAALEVYQKVREHYSVLDVLINNAGVGAQGRFDHADLKSLTQMMQLDMVVLVELTRLFVPQMVERKSGHILNVASSAAFVPGPFMAVYYASKAFVLSFSESLANELREDGVSVTVLCPGPVKSEFQIYAYHENPQITSQRKIPTAQETAEYGYKAMQKKTVVAIPGWKNASIPWFKRVLPRDWVVQISRHVQLNHVVGFKKK